MCLAFKGSYVIADVRDPSPPHLVRAYYGDSAAQNRLEMVVAKM
jgi:hypothetical protein